MPKQFKANTQLQVLAAEFSKNSHWDTEKVIEIADKTGLSIYKVYKWAWDQKKKIGKHKAAQNQLVKPSKRKRNSKLSDLFSKKAKKMNTAKN
jgi:hypothetical protein